jgi:outer membrane protein
MLVSGLGVSAIAQTAAPAADTTPNAPGTTAPATPAGPSKIAVIMFEQAVGATNEGQRNFGELQKKFEPKRAELKTKSDEIDALKKQSQSTSATLSEDQRATLLKTIDEKEKALQRAAEDAQTAFQSEGSDTYGKLAEKFYQVMQAYAQQNGYTLVLDASQSQQSAQQTVLWASDSTNITLPVIQAYNVKSGVPAPPAPAAGAATTPRSTTPRPRTTTPPAAKPQQ